MAFTRDRPIVKEVKKYASKVTVSTGEKTSDASKLMAIMSMAIKKGAEVTITAEGEDEDAAVEALEKFFRENL